MFEFIRTHQRIMQFLLILLIVPSFALVGISGYKSFGDDANTIAKVGGQAITQQEWESAQRQQLDRYRRMMGDKFDQRMFDTPEARQAVLDQLIAQRAVSAEVVKRQLTISDAALQKVITQTPGLVKEDGTFDMDRYKTLLAAQGMTPEMFDASLRRDLALQQLTGAIETTAITPRAVTARLSDISAQEREVQEMLLPVADFISQVKVTDDMVKAFYDKNAKLFETPEQAKAEYVVLDNAAVASTVSVTDAEISAFYNDKKNQARFTVPEQRRLSHILVAVKKDASAADKAAAKAKADAIAAEVKKAPEQFAAIAKAKSEDPVSAEAGGDLDVMVKGGLPKPVEDTAVAMKQGDISEPVLSEFGYHILKVTSLTPAVLKPLEAVKAEIASDLGKQKAAAKYSELAEQFTNTVYEQSDSLKPVADKLKLTVQTLPVVTRNGSPELGAVPFNDPKFLKALFSDDVLKNKRNTEAVEVASNTLISGRIVEFKAASRRPLAEVEPMIRQRVTQEEALKLAKKAGETKLAALKAADNAAGFGEAKMVSRSKADGVNPAAVPAILRADVTKLPAYVGVEVPGAGYGIYRIGKVQQAANQDQARRDAEKEQINGAVAQQEMFEYVEYLKQKAKVKIVKPVAAAPAEEGSEGSSGR
jgi:peptidyl-prolyl cis-trans isomerase D